MKDKFEVEEKYEGKSTQVTEDDELAEFPFVKTIIDAPIPSKFKMQTFKT